ncbi:MAG TPA: hypothetical protein DC047_18245 [Blastocatellia bacterium]|nr:hypothetical protein [Blastocatellia bacterium]
MTNIQGALSLSSSEECTGLCRAYQCCRPKDAGNPIRSTRRQLFAPAIKGINHLTWVDVQVTSAGVQEGSVERELLTWVNQQSLKT